MFHAAVDPWRIPKSKRSPTRDTWRNPTWGTRRSTVRRATRDLLLRPEGGRELEDHLREGAHACCSRLARIQQTRLTENERAGGNGRRSIACASGWSDAASAPVGVDVAG